MAHTINANACEPNSLAIIKGKVAFSRVMTPYTVEEARVINERNRQRAAEAGRTFYPSPETPYTTITIADPQVCYMNPASPTMLEQYAAERIYDSKNGPRFTAENKGRFAPNIIKMGADGNQHLFVADAEPDSENDVVVLIRCFELKNGPYVGTKGVSLEAVFFPNDTISYRAGGSLTANQFAAVRAAEALAQAGLAPTNVLIDDESGRALTGNGASANEYMEGTEGYNAAVAAQPRTAMSSDVQAAVASVPQAPAGQPPVPIPQSYAAPAQPAPPANWQPTQPAGYTEQVAPAPGQQPSPTKGIVFNPNPNA